MSSTRSMGKKTEQNLKKSEDSTADLEEPSTTEIMSMLKKIDASINKVVISQANLESRFASLEVKLNDHDIKLKDFEKSFNYNAEELADMKSAMDCIKTDSMEKSNQILELNQELKNFQHHIDQLERHSRGFNLRFIGIPESETQENCVDLIQKLVLQTTGLIVDIENAHRTGWKKPNIPRQVIARFVRRPQRFDVLIQSKAFKKCKIYVTQDLIQKDFLERRKLTIAYKEAKEKGQTAKFVKGNLFIDGKKFNNG